MGKLSGSVFDLKANIINKSAVIDLALKINPELGNPLSIKLKGNDVSKNLVIFSLPKSLKGVSSYMDSSINIGSKNSIYFNYTIPGLGLNADLNAKIFLNESKLVINEDSIIDITRPIIEADDKNMYIFSPSGKVTNFSAKVGIGTDKKLNLKNVL